MAAGIQEVHAHSPRGGQDRQLRLLSALADSTSDFVWAVDPDTHALLYCNASARHYFLDRRGRHIAAGMRLEELGLPPDLVARWHDYYLRATREGAYRTEHLTATGACVLQLNVGVLRDAGEIVGISVFGRDVTERRRAAEDLRLSNQRLGFVLAATGDAVWDCDLVTGIVTHNRRWCDMLGFSDDLLEHPVGIYYELIHPEDRESVRRQIDAALASESRYEAEYRLRRADGEHLWIFDHGQVVARDANGRACRIVGAFSDISERKRVEEQLRLQTDAMTYMAEGVSLVGSDGVIMYANPRFEAMFGYAAGELIGQPVALCNASAHADPLATAGRIMRALKKQGSWRGEVHNRRKDGGEFWTHATVSSFPHATHGTVWLGVHTDITQTRRLQQERDEAYASLERLAARMQEDSEELRREFSRAVHDEIGAALTAMRMQIEALSRLCSLPAPLPSSKIDYLLALVDEAVVSCRALATRMRPPMLDHLGLAETCRWYLADWSQQTGIRSTGRWSRLPAEPADALRTDLFRILQELLTNVARHSAATRVTVTLTRGRRGLRLRVRDNGHGFADTDACGFGLTGIRERLRRHGGTLVIDDRAPGAALVVTVPVAT